MVVALDAAPIITVAALLVVVREKAPSELPYPAIGDIVRYPGKWEGEYGIGQIRFLQRIA